MATVYALCMTFIHHNVGRILLKQNESMHKKSHKQTLQIFVKCCSCTKQAILSALTLVRKFKRLLSYIYDIEILIRFVKWCVN